jgi:hypothetical protein
MVKLWQNRFVGKVGFAEKKIYLAVQPASTRISAPVMLPAFLPAKNSAISAI